MLTREKAQELAMRATTLTLMTLIWCATSMIGWKAREFFLGNHTLLYVLAAMQFTIRIAPWILPFVFAFWYVCVIIERSYGTGRLAYELTALTPPLCIAVPFVRLHKLSRSEPHPPSVFNLVIATCIWLAGRLAARFFDPDAISEQLDALYVVVVDTSFVLALVLAAHYLYGWRRMLEDPQAEADA